MKTLRYLVIVIILIIATAYIFLFYPFVTGTIKQEFVIKDIVKDTTFQFERYNKIIRLVSKNNTSSWGGLPFSLHATGEIDNNAEVSISYVDSDISSGNGNIFTISSGKVDTTWEGEFYEDRAKIIFKHKDVKSGKLNLVYQVGNKKSN